MASKIVPTLDEIQATYFNQAKALLTQHTNAAIKDFEEFKKFFTPKNAEKPEIHAGFVKAYWCEDPATLEALEALKVTVRCMPLEQSGKEGICVLTGKKAAREFIFAKAY